MKKQSKTLTKHSPKTVTSSRSASTQGFLAEAYASGQEQESEVEPIPETGLIRTRLLELKERLRLFTQLIESYPYSQEIRNSYKGTIERIEGIISKLDTRVSALLSYERSNCSSSVQPHRISRSTAQAGKESLLLHEELKAQRAVIEELFQQFMREEPQSDPPKILLPQEEKRAIENQPYGKLVCIEQMSEKVQEAIKKGMSAGEFIRQEMIRPSGQKQEDIAAKIHVHQASLSYMLNGKTSLSPEMAAKLSHHFQTYTTQELLTLQAVNDAKKADRDYSASLQEQDRTPA